MPFIGRDKRRKAPRTGCPTPRWTAFIRARTLWKCPKCGATYRLDKTEWAMDCIRVEWIQLTPPE